MKIFKVEQTFHLTCAKSLVAKSAAYNTRTIRGNFKQVGSRSSFFRVLTAGKIWLNQYDPDNKRQSKQWLSSGSASVRSIGYENSFRRVLKGFACWVSGGNGISLE